jgi:hypothetical protein
MKYLEWKSDSSEEESFHLVTSRKTKKTKRRIQRQKKEHPGGKRVHPFDEASSPAGGILRSCSKYNLRKGAAWGKIS